MAEFAPSSTRTALNIRGTNLMNDPCFTIQPSVEVIISYFPQWVISALGLFGNFLVFLIYAKKHPKNPGEIPILLLAFVDLLMCVFSIVFTAFIAVLQPNTREVGCTLPLCIAGNIAFDVPYTFSCGMMCVMTLNRFLAVCRPHSYHYQFSFRRQIVIYFFLLIISICSCCWTVMSCLTAPQNEVPKLVWVIQRGVFLLCTLISMMFGYSKVILAMIESRKRKKV